MHTKCKTSCDLNVSYAHRRIDRIAFTAPTACRKIRTRVSRRRARASPLRFRARDLPRRRRRRETRRRTRRTLVGTSVTSSRITTRPRPSSSSPRASRVTHVHYSRSKPSVSIARLPARGRTPRTPRRGPRADSRARDLGPSNVAAAARARRRRPRRASRARRSFAIARSRARSSSTAAVDASRCVARRARTTGDRETGNTRVPRRSPTDRKDAPRRHTTTLSRSTNERRTPDERARSKRTDARIRVSHARRASRDRAVDARRDAKAFPPKDKSYSAHIARVIPSRLAASRACDGD